MAGAMIGGLLQQGFNAADFRVVDISEEARERLHRQYGVAGIGAIDGQIDEQVVLFAVKPQQMRGVAKGVGVHLRGQLVLSIAAGIRTADLSRWLGGHERIVRAMPNTPALIRAGISGVYAPVKVSAADRDNAQSILAAVGGVVWVQNESDIDAVTAVSGSGPAYVFYFIEALQQAAVELGLSGTQALELAIQTFTGASRLAAGSDDPPAILRARVTSRAGTTEAALQSMEAADIKRKIADAVQAAARRSRELGDEFGRD